jgi:pilus assembly protein CpaE
MGMDPAAIIAFDPALFGQAANNGQMVIEVSAKAPVAEAVRRLCGTLTGRAAAPPAKNSAASIFSSLLKGKKQA